MSDILSSDVKKPIEQPEHDPKSLSDMPIDVFGPILENLDYKQQLKLRKVSKSLRALVDNKKSACKTIKIVCCMHNINITFNNHFVMYTDDPPGEFEDYEDDVTTTVIRNDFKKAAFDDLASTLMNPKLQLEEFSTFEGVVVKENLEECYNEIQRVLEPLNHQLSVKKVDLHVLSPSNLLSILSCLKPGFLENISIWFPVESEGINWRIDSTEMNQVALLDQWKQAKELELQCCFDGFLMKHATHFKKFRFIENEMDGDMFTRIKDFLSKLDNFEQCILSSFMFFVDSDLINELFEAPVFSNTVEVDFEFTWPMGTEDVFIVKKKRENH